MPSELRVGMNLAAEYLFRLVVEKWNRRAIDFPDSGDGADRHLCSQSLHRGNSCRSRRRAVRHGNRPRRGHQPVGCERPDQLCPVQWAHSRRQQQSFFQHGDVNGPINGFQLIKVEDDDTPPTPDPMTFASAPAPAGESSITMTATTASDTGGVEYFFDETSGNPGGSDSGWQDSPTYTDTGLSPGKTPRNGPCWRSRVRSWMEA